MTQLPVYYLGSKTLSNSRVIRLVMEDGKGVLGLARTTAITMILASQQDWMVSLNPFISAGLICYGRPGKRRSDGTGNIAYTTLSV